LERSVPSLKYGDYVRFSELVAERFGLNFPEKRRPDLERGVQQAFAASTCASLDEYYGLLHDEQQGAVDMERLVNVLTIGETHFFRDTTQIDALYYHVLPELIERRRPLRTLRIWSAGCASGEEAYSIAMMLRELLPDVDEWTLTILGTDVNTDALDRARKATYGEWAFREERAKQWRPKYFANQGRRYALVPEVQRMVTFERLNLKEDDYPAFETNTKFMDLVMCRNVTIYFSESVTRQVVDRLYGSLVKGGWLVVGHSEPSITIYDRFQAQYFAGTVLYQRPGQLTDLTTDWDWPTAHAAEAGGNWACPPDVRKVPVPAPGPVRVRADPGPKSEALSAPTSNMQCGRVERARELLEYGRSEQARELLLAAVSEGPEAQSCALLGQACANLGCWEQAERWCRQAVSLDKLSLEAYHTLALVLQHQEKYDQAIDAMKKVVYVDRSYVLGHFGLADLYRDSGQLPQALKSLDNARRLLAAYGREEVIPGSGGVTVVRLRETITRQQQQWSAEAYGLPGTDSAEAP
jgi:chemotaxis protein methyltransferase CheR